MAANFSMAPATACVGGAARADPLLGVAQPGPVLRQRRRGGQHLRGDAGRVRRPGPQPFGHRGCRRGEPGHLRRPVGFVQLDDRRVVDARARTGPDHRCVLHSAYRRDAAQDGPGGWLRRGLAVT